MMVYIEQIFQFFIGMINSTLLPSPACLSLSLEYSICVYFWVLYPVQPTFQFQIMGLQIPFQVSQWSSWNLLMLMTPCYVEPMRNDSAVYLVAEGEYMCSNRHNTS